MEQRYMIPAGTKNISAEVLDESGRIRILPAAFWEQVSDAERMLFCMLHGVYSIPTVELVEYLKMLILRRKAIEIGSGNGVLAEALGIPATDSKQQENDPRALSHLARNRQPPVRYGDNVQEADAIRAVRYYKPDVVIACWVTHKWLLSRSVLGGNESGVDEEEVIRSCKEYIFVGNTKVHKLKPILKLPHTVYEPPWLWSRAVNGSPNFIATWSRADIAG